ncbi:MAG: dihydrolipoyl dehydrogenase [Gemmobacter sp.]
MPSFDLIVIGAGPGGYVCAIRAAQLGLRVAVAEGRATLGGTCLNVGSIPSKALLHATHMLHEAEENFARMGLVGAAPAVDWPRMRAYKDEVIGQNTKGIEFLFKKNGIEWLKGWASIPAPGRVQLGETVHEARAIVIATGSEASPLKGVTIDEEVIVTSTGALELGQIPKTLAVIGGGVIGLEMGSVYARLGAEVHVFEYLDAILPGMDAEVQKAFQRILTRQGLKFHTGVAVGTAERTGARARLEWTARKDGKPGSLEADAVLVATGRRPFTAGLGLEALGVALTARGQIVVDSRFETSVRGIHAIGDAVPGPMLAHKAEDEGIALAEILAGQAGHVNHALVPGVVYTHPEVATVGATEEALKEAGRPYRAGRFTLMGNARAKAAFAAEGFVKILADAETDRILGAHIIGPSAGELIHEVCVAMEFGAAAEDLARTCHAHPTLSEAVREAALACGSGPIHA